jgi:hypothetical protein
MHVTLLIRRTFAAVIAGSLALAGTAAAQYEAPEDDSTDIRWEAWLALPSWPSLNDLQPAAGGSFKQIGYGIGAAAHWPVRQLEHGELMLGIEGAIMATDSDVPVFLDDLLARDAYLGVSAKWRMGKARKFSLDAGLAYHLLDISQLDSNYNTGFEFESWEESTAGFFLGTSWDVSAGRPGKDSGLSLGLKVHFLDFGTVRDENVFITPVLGPDAGELDGPLYALQIGYRWR